MKRIPLVLAVLASLSAGVAGAQTSDNVSASITVPVTLFVDVTGSLSFNTTTITATDFNTGYRQSSTDLTLSHKGNVPYLVKVNGAQTNFDFSPSGSITTASKPISDLKLSTAADFASPLSLGTTAATLVTQASPTSSGSATVRARINLDYTNTPPGTFSTVITFTVAES